ncbi:MAG: hypothetical protein AAFV72_08380 [Cyanobacteria bacterium J06635_1]
MQAVAEREAFGMDKEKVSKILVDAILGLKLRDLLTKYGIPEDKDVTLSYSMGDRESVEVEVPKMMKCLGLPPIVKTFRTAIVEDFVTPASVTFNLTDSFREFYHMPEPQPNEEGKIKLVFKGGEKFEMSFTIICIWINGRWRYF